MQFSLNQSECLRSAKTKLYLFPFLPLPTTKFKWTAWSDFSLQYYIYALFMHSFPIFSYIYSYVMESTGLKSHEVFPAWSSDCEQSP